MRPSFVHALAAACLFALFMVSPAMAKGHCWCEIATGCPKDGGRTAHGFGALAAYGRFQSGKQLDCSMRCAQAAAAVEADLRDDPAALCARLGPGTHHLAAYSKVGHTDTDRRWCDPDHYLGTLHCARECVCPEGYTYDEGAGHCAGHCNGLFVMTRPDRCDMVGEWTDGDPCDGDGGDGLIGPGQWGVEVETPAGEWVMVEDVFADLHDGEIGSNLPEVEGEVGPPPVCGVDVCQ